MSQPMEQEVPPPRDGKLQKITLSTTAARTALNAVVLGTGWVRVKVVGCDVDLLFGSSTVAIPTQGAVGVSGVGYPLLDGTWEEFYLTSDTHVAWDATAAGVLVIWRAGRERVGH